jgi:hypothetical protein
MEIAWNWRRNMDVLVWVRCVAMQKARRLNSFVVTAVGLALFAGGPEGAGLRAAEYTGDAITRVGILIGPAPAFHPLRGWVETPQPSAPQGFVKLPVACNRGSRAPRVWLCFKRGPAAEAPLADLQVATEGPPEGSGFEKAAVLVNQSGREPPLGLYFKRASGPGERVITDLLVRTRYENVRGYECGGQDLNGGAGGPPVYLYYQQKGARAIQGAPFAQGIRPELLNAPDTEYEVARAQIDGVRQLVWLEKLEVRHVTVAATMPFRRTETIRLGMTRQEMKQVTRSLNIGLNGGYAGLKSSVGLTLGCTNSMTYTTSEEQTLTEEVSLTAEGYDRYYAFATVLDVLRVREVATEQVLSEAVSRTDNIGYFVTDRYGNWKSTPPSPRPSR